MKRAGIFIDGTNLYFVQRNFLHAKIDIIKLVEYFKSLYTIYNVFFYLAYREEDDKQEKFYKMLAFSGITVVRKPVKQLPDGSLKGNLDVDMTIDMILTKDNYDVAILVSGDSDFEKLINVLRSFGKEVVCVSTRESSSIEVVNAADRYIDLKDILPQIKFEEIAK
ncbi:MAG: NYN domain-containing protein [Aquificae bacterium]|nr:NYN domain-containing protein [Aquificota bacterium]